MSAYELAQLNIGIIKGPMDSPVMAEFAANLDRINALAEASPGFMWRLQTEDGNATAIRPFDNENMLLNMSVWSDADSLRKFVYRSAHADILRRRRERLELLRRHGPHPAAFTFRETYPAPDAPATEQPGGFEDECPAT
jgi:hypothetical protein